MDLLHRGPNTGAWYTDCMTPNLTNEQREVLQSQHGNPVPVIDEQTRRVYYIISSEQYEMVKALLAEDAFDPREIYPLISKTAGEAGWDDPAMDAYDHYDEHRPQS
jgi:hypothetical protein